MAASRAARALREPLATRALGAWRHGTVQARRGAVRPDPARACPREAARPPCDAAARHQADGSPPAVARPDEPAPAPRPAGGTCGRSWRRRGRSQDERPRAPRRARLRGPRRQDAVARGSGRCRRRSRRRSSPRSLRRRCARPPGSRDRGWFACGVRRSWSDGSRERARRSSSRLAVLEDSNWNDRTIDRGEDFDLEAGRLRPPAA